MGMKALIQALRGDGAEVSLKATEGGLIYVAPHKLLWTAKGYAYSAMATAAVAALVVRPSTVAIATLFNDESGGGKHYFIERAFAHNLVGTANAVYGLWLCTHPVGMTKPTNDITVRNSHSGKAAGGSLSIFDNGATVVADGWFPWGKSEHTITVTTPGGQIEAEVDGRIIIPPQAAISLSVVANVIGATFTAGFSWYEVPENELAIA